MDRDVTTLHHECFQYSLLHKTEKNPLGNSLFFFSRKWWAIFRRDIFLPTDVRFHGERLNFGVADRVEGCGHGQTNIVPLTDVTLFVFMNILS